MKRLILIFGLFALVGCSSTQETIDIYKEKRDKIYCIKKCNQLFTIGLDRANCKAKCVIK